MLPTLPFPTCTPKQHNTSLVDWLCAHNTHTHTTNRSIHRLSFPHPEPHLEQLIAALPTLPSQEAQLHYTAALLLSAYSEWLGVETAAGRCLQLLPP